ncbi:MAG: hypothetical protein M3Q16_06185 [Pseudomonadota bacterium]|nr:hypothetical protein [Pseudomonadota bacterium]
MATTSRRQHTKTSTNTAKDTVAPKKHPHTPATKKVAAAQSHKPPESAKTSRSIQENETARKPVRRAKSEVETDKTVDTAKPKKTKLLRDSYSIPESEHKQIAVLKKRCIDHGKPIKKSYLLRAGIQVLALMNDSELLAAVERVK